MRFHLTGEAQGTKRIAPCDSVPRACKQYHLAERAQEAAHSKGKMDARVQIYDSAADEY